MISNRTATIVLPAVMFAMAGAPAAAGTATAQQMPIQGFVTDDLGEPLPAGDVAVRIFTAAEGGSPVYDSEMEYAGAVSAGRLDIVVGAVVPLLLDDEALYWLELQVGGDEVIGDAAAGRWRFRPGGGSHARPDLEARLAALEAALGAVRTAGARGPAAPPTSRPAVKATAFSCEHGLLGLGRIAGGNGGFSVEANLLQQPVGVFARGALCALLGPRYLQADAVPTGASDGMPARFALHACRPNPFNPRTTIRYDLPEPASVELVVFDLTGRLVRTLIGDAHEAAGARAVDWDGRDDRGRSLGSGVYLCRMTAGSFRETKRMLLVR